nr:major antigen-like [Haemonchus contortus]
MNDLSANSSSSLHWSADMAEQASLSLQSQLKLAKDMGYPEDVILAAVGTLDRDKEGMYLPFESTNAMLDVLNNTSVRVNTLEPIDSLGSGVNDLRTMRSPSKNVPRSSSFHAGSPTTSPRNEQLSRLLRTFEREKIRDREAADSHMARLKARIHDLERINDQQQMTEREIRDRLQELQRRNETLNVELKKCEREKEQLNQTVVELQALTDRLTLENLRNEHQAKDQKELAEHRKKQYDQQISALEESIRALTERCNALAADIKEKDKQLREKTKRIQEIEDRNSQLLASFPRLEEQRRRLETEKEQAVEESEQLRREISRLREKTCAECCICLATKPCVLFLPCRHMVICDNCHAESTITECPTCRTRVGDSMKVFS